MPDDIIEYWLSLARELASKFSIEEFDTSSEMWSWENFGEDIRTLRNKFGIGDEYIDILGFRVDFETGKTIDNIRKKEVSSSRLIPHLYYHTKAQDKGIANEWVKFNQLSGSWACRHSYDEKDIKSLVSSYVEKKEELFRILDELGAKRVDFGDAGFEVSFLPMVKVLLIFEDADDEFPASARLLYDRNSVFYLPHEMLGTISWLLASRALSGL